MLRAILRNVQNSLVLGSVLLVVMAMQRLHSFDVTHHAPVTHQHPLSDDYQEEEPAFRVGAHHQVALGREFHIGLFRFVLPRLIRTETMLSAQPERAEKKSNVRSADWKIPNEKKRPQKEEEEPTSVALMVNVGECTGTDLEAALVLKQSLVEVHYNNFPDFQLHALTRPNITEDCRFKLGNASYHLIQSREIHSKLRDTCLSDEALVRLYANYLENDLVIYAPLPSMVVSYNKTSTKSIRSRGGASTTTQPPTSLRTWNPHQDPLPPETLEHVIEQCHQSQDTLPAVKQHNLGLPPWKLRSCDALSRTCRISNRVALSTFAQCLKPHECTEQNGNSLCNDDCKSIHKQWWKLHSKAARTTTGKGSLSASRQEPESVQ